MMQNKMDTFTYSYRSTSVAFSLINNEAEVNHSQKKYILFEY